MAAENALAAQARAANDRVSELEKALGESEPVMRRAQQVLADETERNRRNEKRLEEARRSLEEREAALLGQIAERESALSRRAADIEAAAARAGAEYRDRCRELERLKADLERKVAEMVKRARG